MRKTGPEPDQTRGRLRYHMVAGLTLGIEGQGSGIKCHPDARGGTGGDSSLFG
jgi:hypothetical protein